MRIGPGALACCLILAAGASQAQADPDAGSASAASSAAAAAEHRQAVSVRLRQPDGTHLGSGVVVGAGAGGYWLVSNRHVVRASGAVCVVTHDRRVAPALVLPAASPRRGAGLDLALLWLPRSRQQPLVVATLAQRPAAPASLPLVQATGYPAPLQQGADGTPYTESPGLLLPLLSSPLEGGFDLAYSAAVAKGMSGGGVFAGSELIGVNGAHANPLWPGQWREQNGRPLPALLNEKLELVSLGISAGTIQAALRGARIPSAAALERLDAVRCQADQGLAGVGASGWNRSRFSSLS